MGQCGLYAQTMCTTYWTFSGWEWPSSVGGLAVKCTCRRVNPPTIAALQVVIAVEVKISQLPVLTVDTNVHTGAFLTAFYCHFDHPEQYQTMLLQVKNKTVDSF